MRSYSAQAAKPFIEVTNNAFKITLPNTKAESQKGTVDRDPYDIVLRLFGEKKQIMRSDVEKELGVSYATAARILSRLVEQKRIVRIGNTRNTKYMKLD